MHIILTKTPIGFVPGDTDTEEFARKIKLGTNIHADFKRQRNSGFHRKLFALLNLSFEYWSPAEVSSKYGIPEKNFDRFRRDCIILAGYYHLSHRLDGTFRIEADSISFGSMDQDTFDKLYQAILTVVMDKIPVLRNMGEKQVRELTEKFLAFA